jgi:nucleotide-binding universal stress UspA family protein
MIPEIKKILYATDLTKNSNYAFFYAVDMAKRHNAKIFILHSIEPIHLFYSEGRFLNVEDMMTKLKGLEQKTKIEEIKEGIKKSLSEFCKEVETQASLS